MVSGDNFSDGVFRARPALSDVTNRPAKRPFSAISADSPNKSSDDGDSRFAKQVCLGVHNSVKQKCHLQFGANTNPNDKGKGKVHVQPKEKHPSPNSPFCGVLPDAALQNLTSQRPNSPSNAPEEHDLLGLSALPASSLGFGEDALGRSACGGPEERTIVEGLSNCAIETDDGEVCAVDKLASKSGAVEPRTISASHDSRFIGLERCSALKDFDAANSAASSEDLLKNCSCSFCSKAAYIWADLHYQDVKGRLGALRKSHKEASTTLQKFSAIKDKVIHDEQSNESTKLELSLMEQWKSLFVHMEKTFAQESTQLESSFGALKDLRDNCKSVLDLNDNSHSDNH